MREPAVLVFEETWRRPREVVVLDADETPIDGGDVGAGDPLAIVAWRTNAWRVRPCSRLVTLDGESLADEQLLQHGQCIAVEHQRVRFLLGERERLVDEEHHIATCIDPLTSVLNRRQLARHLAQQRAPLAVLMIDIDWMKRINDKYGFMIGDRVLVRTSQRIRDHVVWPACVARYGGEEFVVVLPGLAADQARARAEQIRAAVEPPIPIEEDSITATVSIGIAMHGDEAAVTLRAADENLMRAKQQGRNRVVGP